MKKLIIIALGVLVIGVTSCQKDTEIATPQKDLKLQSNGTADSDSTSIDKSNVGTWD
jgi:hypothetical protein